MDRNLRPERLDTEPNAQDAPRIWRHWLKTFENFLTSLEGRELNQLSSLINFVAPSVYEIIADYETYDDAIATLTATFDKSKDKVFA